MHIDFLGEHVELIPRIAAWHFEEWGSLTPGDSLEKRLAQLERRSNVERIPLTLVALSGAVPVGTVALVESDVAGREDLSPWLVNLLVPRELRRQGIGSALLGRALDVAAELGHRRVHLAAWDPLDFYRRRGWEPIERRELEGRRVTLMRADTRRGAAEAEG